MPKKAEEEVVAEVVAEEVVEEKPVEKAEVSVKKADTKLVGNSFGDIKEYQNTMVMAKSLANSDVVPQAYKGKAMNCLIAINTANKVGLDPLVVMEHLNIIRGKRSWDGQSCSMLVNASPLFKGVELVWVGKQGDDDWGCYVTATSKETGKTVKGATVTVGMAKAEGWWTQNPKWKNLTELMLSYRAYAFFARVHCANMLNGFLVEGELEDIGAKQVADNPF